MAGRVINGYWASDSSAVVAFIYSRAWLSKEEDIKIDNKYLVNKINSLK